METLMFLFVKKEKERSRRRLECEDVFGSFLWERVK
jgi:hypothetical protein